MSDRTTSAPDDGPDMVRLRELGMEKVSVCLYVSDEFFEREKNAIWRKAWLLLGRVNEIPNPGDYFVFDLDVLNASILVVRGRDGKIRAFHNACKHRGAKVRYKTQGTCKALTCSFHGWVYGLEGQLLDVPFKEQFADCPWGNLRLDELSLDVWGGFIFVNLDKKPKHSLEDYLKPLPEALRAYFENEEWQWSFGYEGTFEANWKILVDVQAEGHHGPFLHRRTVSAKFTPEHFPAIPYPRSIGVPYKLGVYRPPDNLPGAIQQTDVSRLALKYGNASLYTEKREPSVMEKYPGAVNASGRDFWMFDDYAIFPNTVFLILDRQLIVQRCWPLGPHRSVWELNHYFADRLSTFGELFSREHGILGEWHTITEDVTTVEGIHRSFRSGAVDGMYLSDLEVGVRSFEKRIMDEIAGTSGGAMATPSN